MKSFIGEAVYSLGLNWEGEISESTYRNLFDETTCLQIQTKATELQNAEPIRLLRLERDRKLTETDWWCASDRNPTKAQLDYRTALRDLPSTASPSLDQNGQLTGVTWPTKPEAS